MKIFRPKSLCCRGHPKKNLELPISTRTDCGVVNTGYMCGSKKRGGVYLNSWECPGTCSPGNSILCFRTTHYSFRTTHSTTHFGIWEALGWPIQISMDLVPSAKWGKKLIRPKWGKKQIQTPKRHHSRLQSNFLPLKIRRWVRRLKGEIWLSSQRTAISQTLSNFRSAKPLYQHMSTQILRFFVIFHCENCYWC
jgi:hypothetical protein